MRSHPPVQSSYRCTIDAPPDPAVTSRGGERLSGWDGEMPDTRAKYWYGYPRLSSGKDRQGATMRQLDSVRRDSLFDDRGSSPQTGIPRIRVSVMCLRRLHESRRRVGAGVDAIPASASCCMHFSQPTPGARGAAKRASTFLPAPGLHPL